MKYYVTQYGNIFFELRKVRRYVPKHLFSHTEITKEQYKKLFYSGKREQIWNTVGNKTDINVLRVYGNANEILGMKVNTILCK